jgi:molybdopterin synthase catalytic subunit
MTGAVMSRTGTGGKVGETMRAPDLNEWCSEVAGQAGSEGIGMMLIHRGIVRGTSRSGDPVNGMILTRDSERLADIVEEARTWRGVLAVRAWVNEGTLRVGDEIMVVLVAGDIRDNVFAALQRLVSAIKTDVVSEQEIPPTDGMGGTR